MKRFIEGADREQSTLLPESPDDWIDDSNPVRAVDVFVDGLNLIKLRNGHIAEYPVPATLADILSSPFLRGQDPKETCTETMIASY